MKQILVTMVFAVFAGCAAVQVADKPSVEMEIRPGSLCSAEGLTEMTVAGSDQAVYVSSEVVLTNEDIASSRVLAGPMGPQIEIVLTDSGTERLALATGGSVGEHLCIFVDGKLISAPKVLVPITGGMAVISGLFSDEEAKRIADGIAGR